MTDHGNLSTSASPHGTGAALEVVKQQIARVLAVATVEDLSAACQAISDAVPPLESNNAIGGDPVRALVSVGRYAAGAVLEDGRFDLNDLKDGVLDPEATWSGYIDEGSWAAVMIFLLDDDAEAWSSGVNPLLDLLVTTAVALRTLNAATWVEGFERAVDSFSVVVRDSTQT